MPRKDIPLVSVLLPAIVAFVLLPMPGAAAQSFSVIYNFAANSGDGPSSPLVMDSSGNLYGTTEFGGPTGTVCPDFGCGVVYQLVPNANGTWSENQLFDFLAGSGAGTDYYPYGPIAFDSHGNLYGAATSGGSTNGGTAYKLSPVGSGWSRTVIHNFSGGSDGKTPLGIAFSGGQVYGATQIGGTDSHGVVFYLGQVSVMGYYELVAHAFGLNNGDSPNGWLTLDSAGNIYGTSSTGGAQGHGLVFRLAPNHLSFGYSYTDLYDFTGGADGASPSGYLALDAGGNLYGSATFGGQVIGQCSSGCGTVFKLTHNSNGTWTPSVLYTFQGYPSDGQYPSGVLFDGSGSLYGETSNGGPVDQGTVFKLTPNGGSWMEGLLHSFDGSDGSYPAGGLLLDQAGNLYGVTAQGGPNQGFGEVGGVAFKIVP